MGPAVVVVFDPQAQALPCRLEGVELGPHQKLLPHAGPEPLHLTEGHRVLWPRHEVRDPVLLEFDGEAALAPPVGVLAAAVGEHFLRRGVFADRHPVRLDHGLRRRRPVQVQADDVPRVIVHEGDHVRVFAAEPEREQIALPHLVWRRPFEEPGPGQVAPRLRGLVHETGFVEPAPHRFRAGRQQEKPPHGVGDLLHPVPPVGLLQLDDLLRDRRGQTAPRTGRRLPLQASFPVRTVLPQPRRKGGLTHPRFFAHQILTEPFLQVQPDRLQLLLKAVPTPLLPGPRTADLLLGHCLFRFHDNTPCCIGVLPN